MRAFDERDGLSGMEAFQSALEALERDSRFRMSEIGAVA
jgi:hypothetical protein